MIFCRLFNLVGASCLQATPGRHNAVAYSVPAPASACHRAVIKKRATSLSPFLLYANKSGVNFLRRRSFILRHAVQQWRGQHHQDGDHPGSDTNFQEHITIHME